MYARTDTVISARARRRKRRSLRWAIVRGVVAFILATGVLLLSAWLGGDLGRRHAAAEPQILAQPILAEELPQPASRPALRPIRRLHRAADQTAFAAIGDLDALEVLSADELDGISQAHHAR